MRLAGLDAQKPIALAEFYLSRRDALERFLVARLGNRDEAQDVLQELFLRVSQTEVPPDLRDPAAYLYRVALNLAHDYRRSRQRSRAREASWVDARYTLAGSDAVDDVPSAEESYGAKQRVDAVRGALDDLSPQCRRVFLLHKFEGLSHEEVSQRAGISRSTVEKHMNTALKHLIGKLGRD